MTMILPTINVVARPCGLPPNWFTAVNSGDTYCVDPVNRIIKDPVGCARENYSITTGDFLGYLIESASTNLLGVANNRLFTSSPWTITNGTAVISFGTGIEETYSGTGTGSCTLITPTTGQIAVLKCTTSTPITLNVKYTISVYARSVTANTSTTVKFTLNNATSTQTKTVNSTSWSRIYSGLVPTSVATLTAQLNITGDPIYLDFIQVEKGNLTSVIPGYQGSYARAVDSFTTVTPYPFTSLINSRRGTYYMQYTLSDNSLNIPKSIYGVLTCSASPIYLKIAHITSDDTTPSSALLILGVTNSTYSIVPLSGSLDTIKLAISYEFAEFPRISVNGATPVQLLNAASTLNPTTISLGMVDSIPAGFYTSNNKSYTVSSTTNQALDGHLNHFAYFPSALSNADLQAITTL